jgi:DNA-binding FadR family transcriptional regulator
LATAVALGAFLPGDRLPVERELAQLLGVGRSTVREAFSRLRAAGLVEIRRGRAGGAYVLESWTRESAAAVRRTLHQQPDLEDLLDLRARVEELVARAAAQRRTTADIAELEAALAAFAQATEPAEEHRLDTRIHDAVLTAAGNRQIVALSRDLLARVTLGFPIEPYREEVFQRAVDEHSALVEAIIDGDAERAGEAARTHFGLSAETLRATLARSTDPAGS